MFLYHAALKQVATKIDILNDEFQYIQHYNPIEHVKSRIKTPESIVKKLKKDRDMYQMVSEDRLQYAEPNHKKR